MCARLDGETIDLVFGHCLVTITGENLPGLLDDIAAYRLGALRELPPEYRHAPKLALASGTDGLDTTRIILKHAAAHLNPGGLLVVEIGHNCGALETAFPDLPFTWLEVEAGDEFVFLLHREDL